MKLIAVLLFVATGMTGVLLSSHNDKSVSEESLHRSCQCSAALCGCTVSCLDVDEIPSCTCGPLTCICVCNPKDHYNADEGEGGDPVLPTMNGTQQDNSQRLENYLRNRGSAKEVKLADGIRGLREAITEGDARKYLQQADLTENTYATLPSGDKSALDSWMSANIR